MFPDEPYFLARQMLGAHVVDTLRRSVCDPHANRGKAGRELALGGTNWRHGLRRLPQRYETRRGVGCARPTFRG